MQLPILHHLLVHLYRIDFFTLVLQVKEACILHQPNFPIVHGRGVQQKAQEQFPNVLFETVLSCKCFLNSVDKFYAFKNFGNQLVAT